ARDLRRRLRRPAGIVARDEDMDLAADLLRGGDGIARGGLQRPVVVLGDDEDGHQITFASLRSFSTSSFASATLTPALPLGGSTAFKVVNLGETSTPSVLGLSVSSVFFFAFMMFGSVT